MYYLSLPKFICHISWILKLKHNWMIWKRGEKDRENFTQLNTKDAHNGLETLIKIAQHQLFPLEIEIAILLSQRISTATGKFYCCLHLLIKKISYLLEED